MSAPPAARPDPVDPTTVRIEADTIEDIEPDAIDPLESQPPTTAQDGWLTRSIAVLLLPFVAVWEMGARAIESVRLVFRLIGRGLGWPFRAVGRLLRAITALAVGALRRIGGLLGVPLRLIASAARRAAVAVGSLFALLRHPYRWLRRIALTITHWAEQATRTLLRLLTWPARVVLTAGSSVAHFIAWTSARLGRAVAAALRAIGSLFALLRHPYRWLRRIALTFTHWAEQATRTLLRLLTWPARVLLAALNTVIDAISWTLDRLGRAAVAFLRAIGSPLRLAFRWFWAGVRFVGRRTRRVVSLVSGAVRAAGMRVRAAGQLVHRWLAGPWRAVRVSARSVRGRFREAGRTVRASVRTARTQVREAVRSAVGRRD